MQLTIAQNLADWQFYWLFSGSSPGMQDVDNWQYVEDYLEFNPDPVIGGLPPPPQTPQPNVNVNVTGRKLKIVPRN